MQRLAILYLATLVVLLPLDIVFLATLGKRLFQTHVGEYMLPTPRLAPAIAFYILYVAGIVTFVNRSAPGDWRANALSGALFGLFCYATFELTSMALFRRWSWSLVIPDILWGTFVTAAAAGLGGLLATLIFRKI